MPLTLNQTVAPAREPVTLAEAKDYARVLHSFEDQKFRDLIRQARERIEVVSRRQLIDATYEWKLDGWPAVLSVPRPPLSSVTSITYLDENGNSQTWASSKYQTDTDSQPGRIIPVEGESYPLLQLATLNVITVKFVAGYGTAGSSVPWWAKASILWLVNHVYVQRDPVAMGAAFHLLPESLRDAMFEDRVAVFA